MSATTRVLLVKDDVRHEVETVCEPINEWLAITPEIARLNSDDLMMSGRFVVTHVPSGYAASQGSGCIECCRYLGGLLANLDWPSAPSDIGKDAYTEWLNGHVPDVLDRLKGPLNLSWLCDAEDCERDGDDAVGSVA